MPFILQDWQYQSRVNAKLSGDAGKVRFPNLRQRFEGVVKRRRVVGGQPDSQSVPADKGQTVNSRVNYGKNSIAQCRG